MFNILKWSYSVGHVFNDLCATMWFFYTMPYLLKVVQMKNDNIGTFMLIGQIADAITTPVIGIESDKRGILCRKTVGKRKSWHLLGTILVALSFPFLFNSFFKGNQVNEVYLLVYFAPLVVIFQFGWAVVQVTHLSLIPVLIQEGQDNNALNSLRYFFTVISSVVIMIVTTILFQVTTMNGRSCGSNSSHTSKLKPGMSLSPCDQSSFLYITIGIVIVGLIFATLFHLGVHEKDYLTDSNDESFTESSSLLEKPSEIRYLSNAGWFKKPQFYLINLLYLGTRLIVNVSQVYLILFIEGSLRFSKIYGPLGALTTFVSGTIATLIIKLIQGKIGQKLCYLIGLLFIAGYCVSISFGVKLTDVSGIETIDPLRMFGSMALLGCGCSLIMVGSLSLTAEMIGRNCSSSAFVYGAMSFSDKLFNGLAIKVLQEIAPRTECPSIGKFYYMVEFYFVGGCSLFVLIIWLIIYPMKIEVDCWKKQLVSYQSTENAIDPPHDSINNRDVMDKSNSSSVTI